LLREYPERGAVPFSSERRWMATMHTLPDGSVRTFVKGDPSSIIERSSFVRTAAGQAVLGDDVRSELEEANRSLAASGLRVLGLAWTEGEDATADLVFAGLVGMIDPPVQGVHETIARFQAAGIRTVMITGDQRATAESIARELGVLRPGDRTLDGREMLGMADDDLTRAVGTVGAFSRVSPEDKLRIVASLQERGEIVAMLGDGVNDAAALKKAAIGVAMGIRGTDVAREASDVVLTDDRFETVSAAIEEGRVIYDNIRKFVFYLFSCNLAEVLVLMIGLLAGLPLPLLPLQILWLNLVTDTFPALALALEPADPDVMKRPPRDPSAALLSRGFLLRILQGSSILTASTLAAFLWGLQSDPERAVTLCFMTLALGQILHLGNARSRGAVIEPSRALANRWALGAVALSAGLQLLTILLPGLRVILDTVAPTATEWLVIGVCASAPAIIGQTVKVVRSRRISRS
jgi:Ca2+-transporting ATPase